MLNDGIWTEVRASSARAESDRQATLIANLPNIYLYAANNPSEATLAKRRSNAITVTHLTPPLARAGLYKGLVDLKDTLTRLRGLAPDAVERDEMELLVREQAEALDLTGDTDALWLKLLETEGALITDGLHVLGKTPDAASYIEKAWAHSSSKGFDSPAAHERWREPMRLRC